MYLLQIADLHIGSAIHASFSEEEIVTEAIKKISNIVPREEDILICICGDLIDSKDLSDENEILQRYKQVGEIIKLIKVELDKMYSVTIKVCAGNHDVTHIDEFYQCVKNFDASIKKEDLEYSYVYKHKNMGCFIFVNSCDFTDYSIGIINYEKLKMLLKTLPEDEAKVMIFHHTLMSMDSQDTSSIRNAAQLIEIINCNNVVAILHGHNHSRNILTVGKKQCKLIGVGALFSRGNPDVNSQFNLINYTKGIFKEVQSCLFMADIGNESKWSVINIDAVNCENYFCGKSFSVVYNELVNKLQVVSPLHNMVLQIDCAYEDFLKDMNRFFKDDRLIIGERSYTYDQLASMWEETIVPSDLYFNHGIYFKVGEEHGIKLIARKLKDKPTSNRTVLATYNMKTILETIEEEQKILPSLSTVQFSKDNDARILYIHMHLRSLEAGRFLKINVNEIRWMLEQLVNEAVSFNEVSIVISAFRVQVKDKFNCFIKARIDEITPEKLTVMVCRGEIDYICGLLEEKRDSTETITHSHGIRSLEKALMEDSQNTDSIYNENLVKKLGEVIKIYDKLDEIHKKHSIQSDEEKENEKKIADGLNQIIKALKSVKTK